VGCFIFTTEASHAIAISIAIATAGSVGMGLADCWVGVRDLNPPQGGLETKGTASAERLRFGALGERSCNNNSWFICGIIYLHFLTWLIGPG